MFLKNSVDKFFIFLFLNLFYGVLAKPALHKINLKIKK